MSYHINYLIAFANILLVLLFSLLLLTETVVEEILLLNASTAFLSQQFLYLIIVLFKLVYHRNSLILINRYIYIIYTLKHYFNIPKNPNKQSNQNSMGEITKKTNLF